MAEYKQVLLDTEDGLFAVSVTGSVLLNDRKRIVSPQKVFKEGSTIVAVELGKLPAGEYIEEPNPYDIEQAEAQAGGNGGPPQPKPTHSDGPRYGTFMVKYTESGGISLRVIPPLGEIT
jgi:hypothetical protein